ncbi:Pectin lyase fold/virulence factor [Beauveria bassiana ARSEF 2860]|uniref:Pectin lyase fold/virulence factor n=1 Tax=Beauveria bassiana (strain ARSEF 2860) TaxID=655819 RepID=J4UG49_BEAB2|nr:Pectin lyase fold/virulence factor [Beauveria bassiana ARSEF 2860]EJP61727.1 Pectin lyase fold/virulence factor [Beauveria bassiana ARSEF 2860]
MAWLRLVALLAPVFITLLPPVAEAQYYQDYMPDTTTPGAYLYRAVPNQTPWRVINVEPYTVYLSYNCHYMREICKNVEAFQADPRWQNLHPLSGISNNVYGYDLDTGEDHSHQESRRLASCPGDWKSDHRCPETDQSKPMRQNGEWFTTALEPGTDENVLEHLRDSNNNIIAQSGIRYSCDEFPPATWVEGGNGWDRNSPAKTRCAAIACAQGVKAEQNYNPEWDSDKSILLFRFLKEDNGADGVAAIVTTTREDRNAEEAVSFFPITQAKRSATRQSALTGPGLTSEELKARVKAGRAYQTQIHENLTITKQGLEHRDTFKHDYLQMRDIARLDNSNSEVDVTLLRPELESPELRLRSAQLPPRIVPLVRNATSSELNAARRIVEHARAESDRLNRARLANPLRSRYFYGRENNTVTGAAGVKALRDSGTQFEHANQAVMVLPPPLLPITDEIAAAAALVAEADLNTNRGNWTRRAAAAGKGTFWMQKLTWTFTLVSHGKALYLGEMILPMYVYIKKFVMSLPNQSIKVIFRNVLDYGAVGDGVTDDTKAINKAMGTNSTRCDRGCNGSTTKNAIVYFPPGKYLVSSTIAMPFGTQVIGDANDRPTLVAAPSFVGLGVLSTDEYTGADGAGIDGKDPEYFVNTANFYRQIRNIRIDIRKVKEGSVITGIHYQVAQATSTQNVELIAQSGTDQIGMYAENGSGGSISDITFTGGGVGLKAGSQQFTAQRLNFDGCDVGIQVIWDWGWVWKSITMKNVGIGFKLVGDGGVGNRLTFFLLVGSVSILDSSFTGASKAIVVKRIESAPGKGSTGISLENIALSEVEVAVADTTGATLLASSALIDQWAVGPIYEGSTSARSFSPGGKAGKFRRVSKLLDSNGNYFERARPQYESRPASAFIHTKDLGCQGDGLTDDTAAFQAALYASVGNILFIDAGTYILTSTVVIPPGSKIVGETWSQLAASGPYFSDANNPKVMIQVGQAGQIGNVEMQDLLFTTHGPTSGAILVQWNLRAESQGAAGLWDCHARVGGALGTKLTPVECPAATSGIDPGCSAASLMMHLTKSASGYFENMWLWGADHMIDDPDWVDPKNDMTQTSIYVARGFLIESTDPTWLYGTASEHAVFYQYNFHSASNLFVGLLQTESPYFQPTPPPPAPFADTLGKFPGDPDYTCTQGDEFSGCDESWSTIMTESDNIFIAAAGIYSWFSTYSQSCIDTQQCQKALMLLKNNFANIRITNLVTIGAKYMAVMDGKGIPAIDNLNVEVHPKWSQISILDVGGNGSRFDDYVWIDPKIWEMDQPHFTCSLPCKAIIPPWTGATSTVNYPFITVSQGTWTSTITQAPLTITEWIFEAITETGGSAGKHKRAAETIRPVPATTPYWPAVVYKGSDGKPTTTSATGPFPTPPKFIGPGAPAPPSGSWPKPEIVLYSGDLNSPIVPPCSYLDFENSKCINQPWFWGSASAPGGDDGDIENLWEAGISCPVSTSTSTSATSSTKPTQTPALLRFVQGDPQSNKVKCYNSGEDTEDERMQNAAKSFCDILSRKNLGPGFYIEKDFPFPYNGGLGTVVIKESLEVKEGCSFGSLHTSGKRDLEGRDSGFDETLCERYLSVPADSCNCGGINHKQGGVIENDCYIWRVDPNRRL